MKTTKISNALEEVWEWKKKCYEESKDMTILNYLKKIHKNADAVLSEMDFLKGKRLSKKTSRKSVSC
ncbi:MAG: hypothetical protein HZB79_02185 [Deltaproteobacteria bacterium]|nr:hypothetical protein [Deltaproteobacteria bacterium]